MNFAKKIIIHLILLSIIIFLYGCTGAVSDAGDINETTATTEEGTVSVDNASGSTAVVDGIINQAEYGSSIKDNATGIELYWSNDSSRLNIGMITGADGWAAVGFDPQTSMSGANIIFMALDGANMLVRDDFGTSVFAHSDDESLGGSNDIIEYSGTRDSGISIYEFSIPLDSKDEFDKVLVPGNTYKVILALNSNSTDFNTKHSLKNKAEITLGQGK